MKTGCYTRVAASRITFLAENRTCLFTGGHLYVGGGVRPLVIRLMPGLVGVIEFDVLCDFEGIRSKVLLIDDSLWSNDEGLDAGDTVLGRRRDQRKSPDHGVLDQVVELTQRCGRPLAFQDLEIVAMVGSVLLQGVSFREGFGNSFAHPASGGTVGVLPIEAVLFSGSADESLRVLIDAGIVMDGGSVIALRFNISATDLDGIQFIGADAAVQNFF